MVSVRVRVDFCFIKRCLKPHLKNFRVTRASWRIVGRRCVGVLFAFDLAFEVDVTHLDPSAAPSNRAHTKSPLICRIIADQTYERPNKLLHRQLSAIGQNSFLSSHTKATKISDIDLRRGNVRLFCDLNSQTNDVEEARKALNNLEGKR